LLKFSHGSGVPCCRFVVGAPVPVDNLKTVNLLRGVPARSPAALRLERRLTMHRQTSDPAANPFRADGLLPDVLSEQQEMTP
jgi:hypothetical protein